MVETEQISDGPGNLGNRLERAKVSLASSQHYVETKSIHRRDLLRIEALRRKLDSRASRQLGGRESNEFPGSHLGLQNTEVLYAE